MRNGFSYADSTKTANGIADETTMFQTVFTNPTKVKPVIINQKVIPFIQAIHADNFATRNAAVYFKYAFELIRKIDHRLNDKQK